MHLPLKQIALFVSALLAGARLCARDSLLAWESTTVLVTASPDVREVSADFQFRNTGQAAIKINALEPSCGCTTAALEKSVYASGQSGHLQAVFNIGERTGFAEESIVVRTDETGAEPVKLVMKIQIQSFLDFTPHLLLWKVGEAVQEKIIDCTPGNATEIDGLEAHSSIPSLSCRVETVEPKRRFRIHIVPTDTDHHLTALIEIRATILGGVGIRTYRAYAYVVSAQAPSLAR